MAETNDHGPSIKDNEQYQALREQGMSKEKAARIANTPRSEAARRGGQAPAYAEWSKEHLHDRAYEIGIDGHADMRCATTEACRRPGRTGLSRRRGRSSPATHALRRRHRSGLDPNS
jgi:hypothetical protein